VDGQHHEPAGVANLVDVSQLFGERAAGLDGQTAE
jgi:hypothetical protein